MPREMPLVVLRGFEIEQLNYMKITASQRL
jgi:hypothetical protein